MKSQVICRFALAKNYRIKNRRDLTAWSSVVMMPQVHFHWLDKTSPLRLCLRGLAVSVTILFLEFVAD